MSRPTRTIIGLLVAVAGAGATASPALAGGRLAHAPVTPAIGLSVYPNPGLAGEPALLAGRVTGPGAANATVTLWQRLAGATRATQVAQLNADPTGAFVFTRAQAPLDQTANLYTTALSARSRPLREQVQASVTLSTASTVVVSGSSVSLDGRVLPTGHLGEPVVLQQRSASGWATIAHATLAADGSFNFTTTFSGVRTVTLRAQYAGDVHNLGNTSDPLDLLVQSSQTRSVALVASPNPLIIGQSLALSGSLTGPGSTGLAVSLLAGPDPADVQPVTTATTDGNGNFSFLELPSANTVYRVSAGSGSSAPLIVGVQATVTLDASTLSAPLGATQVVRGAVTGAGSGTGVALQLLGSDGVFHTISRGRLTAPAAGSPGAGFSFTVTLTDPGSQTYRVLAGGDSTQESSVSAPLTVVVSPRAASLVAAALAQA